MTSDVSSPREPLSGPALADAYLEHLRDGGRQTPEDFLADHGSSSEGTLELLRIVTHLADEEPFRLGAGQVVGPYHIDEPIGFGGMGTVYRATVQAPTPGLAVDAQVAIKVIHPHLLSRPGFFKRFLREAEVGKRVRHENVVAALDVDATEVDGWVAHYLAMEHVEGRTLRELLHEHGSVPEALLREIASQTAAGLAAIHAAGIVHRDLKPENILITNDHRVRIMDLGVARLLDESELLTREGQFAGTLAYAAPEQFGSGEVGPRADLYALGVVLYELATGENPFRRDETAAVMRAHLDEVPVPLADRDSEASSFLSQLVATLLAKDPAERFAGASDLQAVLDAGERSEWWNEREKTLRSARRRVPKIPVRRETRLHGREEALSLLSSAWRRAEEGQSNTLLVQGEAGIGKTRLVDAFLREREGEDAHVLYGSYPPSGGQGGLSASILEHFGAAGLEDALGPYLTVTPSLAAPLAALLRQEPAPDGAPSLAGDALHAVLVHLMRGLAAEKPLLWVIDDLHFASGDSLRRLLSLARAVEGHRVLLLLTARPGLPEDELSHFGRLENFEKTELRRLGAREVIELLRDAFKSEALAEKLGGKIAYKSDGIPFFVFEMIRGLKEGQFITELPDGTHVETKMVEGIEVPSRVRDLIEARLRDLNRDERAVLDVAAVQGFEFDPHLVARVRRRKEIEILEMLADLERSRGVIRWSGNSYKFDHHQFQEVLYEDLPRPLREAYHRAVAEAMEARLGAEEIAPASAEAAWLPELCEHFLRGGRAEQGVCYLSPALDHLGRTYQHDQAVTLAGRALEAPGLLAGEARLEVLLKMNVHLGLLGSRRAQDLVLAEAAALAKASGDLGLRATVEMTMGVVSNSSGCYDEARAHYERALSILREVGDRRSEGMATGNLGNVMHNLGRYEEAREHHEQNLAIAREIGDRRGEAAASGNLGVLYFSLGLYEQARKHHERNLAIAREIGDRGSEARATGNLGNVYRALGRYEEAREHHARNLAIAREIGDRRGEGMASGNLGNVLYDLGRHDEARGLYERYLAISSVIAFRWGEANAAACLGLVLLALGRYAEAEECMNRQLKIAHETGDPSSEGWANLNLGNLLISLGQPAAAKRRFEAQLLIAREIGERRSEGYALSSLGAVAFEQGERGLALDYANQALEMRRRIGHKVDVAGSLMQVGEYRWEAGDHAKARDVTVEAVELIEAQSRKPELAHALALLANLPDGDAATAEAALHDAGQAGNTPSSRHHLWKATGKPEHLAEAKRLLDFRVEHAPEEYRESMLQNVRLNREIMEAWAEHGGAGEDAAQETS